MKKLTFTFVGVVMFSLLYAFRPVSSGEIQSTSKYIIIRYSPYWTGSSKQVVMVSDGSPKREDIHVTKDESNDTSGYIANLLTKYNSQGYELISTTADSGGNINLFLKK